MKKRIVSMLLVLALCLTLLPTAALAAEGETGGSTTPTLGDKLTLEAVAGTEGFDGEGYGNLVDGKNTAENWTKWCFTWNKGTGGMSDYLIGYDVILKAESAVKISGYSFTTGNDNADNKGRNPKSWVLYGSDSQNGDWTEIAAVTNDTTIQDQNFAKFDFVLTAAPDAYQYYKFMFTENQGASVMQLSEIALYGPVCAHEWENMGEAVAATCTTDGYQLQRCDKCGSTKRANVVPATGHDYENGKCTKCDHVCCATLTTADNDVFYYENIKDALDAAQNYDDCIVKLYATAIYYDTIGVRECTFTIDLNGQQAAFQLKTNYDANITLINTADIQATFGGDSIDGPVVDAWNGTVTVGQSDGSDGDILFRRKDNTGLQNETFVISKYVEASLYGGIYMGITCDTSANLYKYLPAGFAFADSAGNEVDATGNTLSEVHIVSHTEHQKDENGFCTICGACDHPAGKVDTDTFQCSQCGRTMLAYIKLGENVTYFSDLNEAVKKAAETDGCTLKLLAKAGALTVSGGTFTLDLNSKKVNSLTVSGGSIKLTNVKKIGTLTVSGDVTLAGLLPEGYAFQQDGQLQSLESLTEKSTIENVIVVKCTHPYISIGECPYCGSIKEIDEITSITAAGNGTGNWLNSASWAPANDSNHMTETSTGSGVYEITYTGVAAGKYTVKFAANDAWTHAWGVAYGAKNVPLEGDAVYNQDSISFSVTENNSTVKLVLDLSNLDRATGDGVRYAITITLPSAAEASPVYVGGEQLLLNTKYVNDSSGSVTVSTDDTCNAIVTGNETDGYTLTISELNVTGKTDDTNAKYKSSAIYTETDKPLTIVVEKDSTVTGAQTAAHSAGVYAKNALTITGSGTLTANGGKATSGGSGSYGVMCNDALTIENTLLNATGGDARESSVGVFGYSVTINGDNTVVTAVGGEGSWRSCGMGSSSSSICLNGGKVIASGKKNAIITPFDTNSQNGKEVKYLVGNEILTNYNDSKVTDAKNLTVTLGDPAPKYHTVSFYTNGGVLSGEGVTVVTANSQYTMQYQEGVGISKLPTPMREGYTFGGWYDKPDFAAGSGPVGSIGTGSGMNFTYYAKWEVPDFSEAVIHLGTQGIYNGTEQSVCITSVTLGGKALTKDVDYEIISGGTATNVEAVRLTIQGKGAYTGVKTIDWSLQKATFDAPTVTMSGYTYGGTLPTPSISTYPGGGAVTYYYSTANSSSGGVEWKDMTATSLNVGTYYMYAVIAESQNYTSVTTEAVVFTVSAAAAPVTVWPTVSGTVYVNDSALTNERLTGGAAGVDGTFTITDTTKTWTESGAKQLKVTFTPESSNYSAVEQSITVTVCKRTVTAVAEQNAITGKTFLTEQSEMGLPTQVKITAEGPKEFEVPVSWSGYDPNTLDEQTLSGTLDLTAISAEVQQPETALTASIKVKLDAITLPAVTFADKTETYTGEPIANTLTAPTGVASVKYEYEGKSDTVYEKSETAPVDVGSYTVTATFTMDYGYNQLAPATSTLTITKASFTAPAVTMSGYTYGGALPTPGIGTYPGGGAVTYYYSTTNSSSGGVEWKDMTATSLNVGNYYMYAVIAESQNYTSVTTETVVFTVSAANAPVTTWPTISGTVYVNDSALTNERLTDGTAGVDGTFAITDTTKTWTDSGEKQLKVTFTPESSNYSAVEGEITVSVVKRTIASVAAQAAITGKLFLAEQGELGLPVAVSITTADGKTFENVPVTWSGYSKNTLDEQTLIGALDLTAISAEVQQPETARTASIKVKLDAITLPAVTFADKTETYTGEPIANTLTAPTGVASVEYEYEGKDGTEYQKSEAAPIDAGTYTVTATFTMDYGYNQLAPATSTLTITKASGSVSAPAARTDLVYNGEAQALIIAGSSTTGTIQYKLNNGEYSTALPEATNAGTYTVSYKVVGDKNHEDVAEKSISVTIAKKPIPAPVADETVFTYNGEKQAYKLEESVDYSISDNVTQTNANEEGYTVTVSLKDKANTVWADTENDTEDKTYQFIIHKAKATVTAKDKTAYVGSAAPDLSKPVQDKDYTIEGLFGEDTLGGTIKLDYAETPNMQKTGTVQINVSGADGGQNYTVSYVPGTLTIKTRPAPVYPVELPEKPKNGTVSMEDNSLLNLFYDVPNNAYYFDAVKWAVENGITGGVGGNLFAPNGDCTRAQIVTFLWRAAGSPEPKSTSSFSDVSADSYYAKAVAWAVENGITTGAGNGLFSPDAACTRAQAVTFLWRAAGSPEPKSMSTFTDVPADAYYAKAVAWAVENDITTGTGSDKFSPDDTCTRAQIVTFLFRAYHQ